MINCKQKGIILVSIMILSAVLLLLGSSLIVLTLAEKKIAKAQDWALDAYYLAESGIAEAVWKLKNDSAWLADFEDGGEWTQSDINRLAVFNDNTSYVISVDPLDGSPAHAGIQVIGKIDIGNGRFAQRIIKTKVFKATGNDFPEDIAVYSGGSIALNGTKVYITGGNAFVGDDIRPDWGARITNDQKIKAIDDVRVRYGSYISAEEVQAEYCYKDWLSTVLPWPCTLIPPEALEMPKVDFDEGANSYKNRADEIYTKTQLKTLLKNNPNLVLPQAGGFGIIYITGNVQIKRGQHLTVNGVLVSDGWVQIGTGGEEQGSALLTINNQEDQPSGLLAKAGISTSNYAGNFNVDGLVYTPEEMIFSKAWKTSANCNINGGLIVKNFSSSTWWEICNITHNTDIIQDAIGQSEFSPVVTVEHWEEEY